MFFNFFFTYKKNLVSASKKYNLQCNWLKNRNYMLKHYFTYAKYFSLLVEGSYIPNGLFNKIHKLQKKYTLENEDNYAIWIKDSMPKINLETMLCEWIATAQTIGVGAKDYVEEMIDDAEIPNLSKRYLTNKAKVL